MKKSKSSLKMKRVPIPSGKRTPAAKVTKTANPGTKAKIPVKPVAKAKLGAKTPKPMKVNDGGNAKIAKTSGVPVVAGSKSHERAEGNRASELIEQRIRVLGDWRGETLARMRELILEADPQMTEEWKWMGTPVWSHHGNVCTGETYKQVVKLTFARGASLKDPLGLFNSSLEGNTRRAIDIREGEVLDANAFKALIQAAVAENLRFSAPKSKSSRKSAAKVKSAAQEAPPIKKKTGKTVMLLTGGNPQIAKADGDAPVQAYIAAMPGWKQDVGRRIDALVVQAVPSVSKAVKWNSPFYGIDGQGWFLSFHVFTRYVKVTFFHGIALRPAPPGGTERSKDARWIDIHEGDELDETQMVAWLKQAAELPGWVP